MDLIGYQSEREYENDKPSLIERISSWLSFPERIATWVGERAGEWFTKTRGQYQAGIQEKLAKQIGEDPELAKEAAFQEAAVIGERVKKEAAETAEPIIQGALEYATGKALSIIGGIRGVKSSLKKPALTVEDSAGKVTNKLKNLSELAEKEETIAKEGKLLKEVVEKENKIVQMEAVGEAAATERLNPWNEFQKATKGVFESREEAVRAYRGIREGVQTDRGLFKQSESIEALITRKQVEQGTTLYRIGTIGKSAAGEAQFWAVEHPSTPGFAQRYGIPPENVTKPNFIETGVLKPGTPFITRKAPGVGMHKGGDIEVIVPKGGVELRTFHYLGGNP